MSALAFTMGALAGFCGAIPPGPVGMAVAAHAADGRARRAVEVGLGAALVDASVCAALALGAGPTLARLTEPAAVRVFLAALYASLGAFLVVEALVRPKARRAPAPSARDGFVRGVARGATNPSVIANWTMLLAGLGAAGALPPGPRAGLAFALGVGLGVSAWFATLARVVGRARGERLAPWLRAAGALTGALLVVVGGVGALRALAG